MIELTGVGDGGRLSAVDLTVVDGTPTVLLGPAAAGKTALLRIIAGLDQASYGQLTVGGQVTVDANRPTIAMVQTEAVNYPAMSVHDNIAAPLLRRGLAKAEVEREVRAMARRLRIGRVLDRRPAQISHEQRQRVAIARALARTPDILLLDDPLMGLGPDHRDSLRSDLISILSERGGVTVFATRDPREAMSLPGQTAVLDGGAIVQTGRFKDIQRAPATLGVAAATGHPPWNVIAGRLDSGEITFDAGVRFAVPDHVADLAAGQYQFALRASHLSLAQPFGGDVALSVTVQLAEDDGVETTVHAHHGDCPLMALLNGVKAIDRGVQAEFCFDPDHLLAFDGAGVLVAAPEIL